VRTASGSPNFQVSQQAHFRWALLRTDQPAAPPREVVSAVEGADRHEFCSDSVSFVEVAIKGFVGHRQVNSCLPCRSDVYRAARIHFHPPDCRPPADIHGLREVPRRSLGVGGRRLWLGRQYSAIQRID